MNQYKKTVAIDIFFYLNRVKEDCNFVVGRARRICTPGYTTGRQKHRKAQACCSTPDQILLALRTPQSMIYGWRNHKTEGRRYQKTGEKLRKKPEPENSNAKPTTVERPLSLIVKDMAGYM